MNERIAPSIPRLLQLTTRPSPSFSCSRSSARAFHSSTIRWRAPAAPQKSPTAHKGIVKPQLPDKIETYPFHFRVEDAAKLFDLTGPTAFGWRSVADQIISKVLTKLLGWAGLRREAQGRRVGLRALLLPVWKVDLSLRGLASVEGTEVKVFATSIDGSLSGYRLPPLHRLAIDTSSAPSKSQPFDVEKHSEQLRSQDTDITVLPFTVSPLNLLAKIANMSRVKAGDISLNPATFDPALLAFYPLYLPVYLAEYQYGEKRATFLVPAWEPTQGRPRLAVYRSFEPSPRWQVRSEDYPIAIGVTPSDPWTPSTLVLATGMALQLGARRVLDSVKGDLGSSKGALPFEVMDPVSGNEWLRNERVMSYSQNAERNREWIIDEQRLESAHTYARRVATMDDSSRAKVTIEGRTRDLGRAEAEADAQRQVYKLKKAVALSKPEWVKTLEAKRAALASSGKTRSARGR